MPDAVNAQVVDAVTTTNVKVLGEAPSVAVDTVLSVLGQTVSLSMQNAMTTQQGMQNIATSITTVGAKLIMDLLK